MNARREFGFEQLVTEILRGLIEAVAERPGENEAERLARHQTAVFSAMAFLPRDAVETMLASHCVMLDHVLRDGIHDLLRDQPEQMKVRLRSQITALGRLFLKHLDQLRRLQTRPVEQIAVVGGSKEERKADATGQSEPMPGTAEASCRGSPTPPCAVATLTEADPEFGTIPDPAGNPTPVPGRGFQNRQQRRAMQFKTPAGHRRQLP